MNKIKISDYQLMIFTSGFVFGTSPLILASSIAEYAKQDAWISVIAAALIGLLFVWLNSFLGGLYPDKTYIEIIQLLFGRWIGGFFSLNLILLSVIAAAQVTWYVGDFFKTQYLTGTPFYAINILFFIGIIIALLYGVETTFRAVEVFFAFAFPLYMISMILVLPNAHIENLFPIMEKGIYPILNGTLPLLSIDIWPLILLNMVYPVNVNDVKKAKKAIFKGYFLGIFTVFVSVFVCILILGGNITAAARFPVFLATKEINIGMILTRLEAIIAFVWLITNFISVFTYSYAGTIGLSQLLKLKDYRKIVLPLGLVIAVFSGFAYTNVPYELSWDTYVWPPYILTFGVLPPVILLIITGIRKLLAK
ncbi:MAG: GerAB/ArcD/ProY family transporter [Ignavibacteriales bacterium]